MAYFIGDNFRVLQVDEDLVDPSGYNQKLLGLQSHITQNSILGTGKPSRIYDPRISPSKEYFNEMFVKLKNNFAVIEAAQFCRSAVTFLQLDATRSQVALMRTIETKDIKDLIVSLGTALAIPETKSAAIAMDSEWQSLLKKYPYFES